MEFVKVTFPTDRAVQLDGAPEGRTNKLLGVERGHHIFDLGEPFDYTPPNRDVLVAGTSQDRPQLIQFEPVSILELTIKNAGIGGVMHRLESRTYVGQPNETVSLTTQIDGGGQVGVIVDGQDLGSGRQFSLPQNPGDTIKLQISLVGPLGASCVVGIAVVDGGSDGDLLVCQAHNPAPVHFYTFSVASVGAINQLGRIKGVAKAKTGKKGGRK
jgi:hypothetical protein